MLQINDLSFAYEDEKIIDSLDLRVDKGRILALTGKSGCGKSTLVSLIYGYLEPDQGKISWNGKWIRPPSKKLVPGENGVNLLLQESDLMPYTSVASNVKKKLSRAEPVGSDKRCDELLKVVDLLGFKERLVKDLSGGQKKRVSIASSLADDPALILLDEPFNYIDHHIKYELRRRFFSYVKDQGITCLFVSHEKEEFLSFADEVAILSDQRIIKKGLPKEVFENPRYIEVAQLLDDVNILSLGPKAKRKVVIYPHELIIGDESDHIFKVKVQNSFYRGADHLHQAVSEANKKIFFTDRHHLPHNSIQYLKVSNSNALKRYVI